MVLDFVKKLIICAGLMLSTETWAYSPYSNRQLDQLEKEFIQLINQSSQVLRDPLAIEYINHLGKRLANHASQHVPYFFIVKSNEINAFAGPGGYIGVNSQLILATANESELAAVMAHEMAHVRLHHLYRMLEHEKQMRIPMLASVLASIALGVVNPALGSGALMASLTGIAQDKINFTRASEKEADRIGIDMLIKSGLDPKGMAGFFKKMQQHTRYYYLDHIPAILRTHPLDDDRIAEAENRSMNLPQKHYSDSLDYRLFKELVRVAAAFDKKQLLDYYARECKKKYNETACHYGYARALLNVNHNEQAARALSELTHQKEDNLFFEIALAEAEIGLRQFNTALNRLEKLYKNYPDHYAILIAYGKGLMAAANPEKASMVLLQASRQFKQDLLICQLLAQSQADNQRKDYAYFTQAQCELLQGKKKNALNQLKLAKRFAKKDPLLQARITAKIEEIDDKFRDDSH